MTHKLPDGSETLYYEAAKFAAFELFALRRPGAEADFSPEQRAAAKAFWDSHTPTQRDAFIRQTLDLFPGVRLGLTLDDFRAMLARYAGLDAAKLKEHLRLFLEAIVPTAERAGVRLAIHPDDPPFSVLGLPRIVSTESDLADVLAMVDSPANGICFCSGSLSARADNDVTRIARRFAGQTHAAHLRSVQRNANGDFFEANHLEGEVDMPAVVRALLEEQAKRRAAGHADWQIAFRPDHGHKMLDDFKRAEPTCPGYPLAGRLRGLSELRGLQLGISSMLG
jgi:mannonate dehydratase